MSGPVKKKLCWNCDASVPLESETCIYCGVSVASLISEGDEEEEPKIAMPPPLYGKPSSRAPTMATSTSAPQRNVETPAREAQPQGSKKRPIPPQPAFRGKPTLKIREEAPQAEEAVSVQKKPHDLLSLFLLLTGSTFFLFGVVILLFSDQGALILRWNREQAFIYLGLGLCSLLVGWRVILRLEE